MASSELDARGLTTMLAAAALVTLVAGIVAITLVAAVPQEASAAAGAPLDPVEKSIVGFGVMGDSRSDEYRADDNRGGAYAATTFNWLELLARYRGVLVGAWGTRPFPRRTGYEYNWARSGATSADILADGQAAGLAQQVAQGKVSLVFLMVGSNDFGLDTYRAIYDGTLSGASLDTMINAIVANIQLAVDTVRGAGPVDVFVANVADRGAAGAFQTEFPDAGRRQRVTNAILAVNSGIQAMAAVRGIPVVDIYGYASILLPRVDANGNLLVGGERISLLTAGDEPHHVLLGDNRHSGTVAAGILANYILDSLNSAGYRIPKFTDQELLNHAGIFPTTLNGDGKPDLLWSHSTNGDVYVWFMDGATQIGGALLGTVADPNWRLGAVADLNQDGKPDFVWHHQTTGDAYVWYMNGATQIGGQLLGTVADPHWRLAAVGDINKDGKPDLLWSHSTSGDVYVWYMSGATQIGGQLLGTVADTRWRLAAVGDINKDGIPDLLWHHSTSGDVYVWYMNGATQIGGALLGTVADPRWQLVEVGDVGF